MARIVVQIPSSAVRIGSIFSMRRSVSSLTGHYQSNPRARYRAVTCAYAGLGFGAVAGPLPRRWSSAPVAPVGGSVG
jgi:hypothetical protein